MHDGETFTRPQSSLKLQCCCCSLLPLAHCVVELAPAAGHQGAQRVRPIRLAVALVQDHLAPLAHAFVTPPNPDNPQALFTSPHLPILHSHDCLPHRQCDYSSQCLARPSNLLSQSNKRVVMLTPASGDPGLYLPSPNGFCTAPYANPPPLPPILASSDISTVARPRSRGTGHTRQPSSHQCG